MSASSGRPATADRALLGALAVWGRAADDRFWSRFRSRWGDRLRAAWELGGSGAAGPETARAALIADHVAGARPDFGQSHPSWWARALRDESPAVRRAVSAHAPGAVGEVLRAGLFPEDDDLKADRPPHPEALRWALILWADRMSGGSPARDDDPPAIAALIRPGRTDRLRLLTAIGLGKWAFACDPSAPIESPDEHGGPLKARDEALAGHFQTLWGTPDPRLVRAAQRDARSARGGERTLPRLGLITIGRLLTIEEPARVRWALQQLPYPIARAILSAMAPKQAELSMAERLEWESAIFRAAVDRPRDDRLKVDGEPRF